MLVSLFASRNDTTRAIVRSIGTHDRRTEEDGHINREESTDCGTDWKRGRNERSHRFEGPAESCLESRSVSAHMCR